MLADSDGEMGARRQFGRLDDQLIALKLRQNETNATDNPVGRLFMRSQGNQEHWNPLVPGTKDEAVCLILEEA